MKGIVSGRVQRHVSSFGRWSKTGLVMKTPTSRTSYLFDGNLSIFIPVKSAERTVPRWLLTSCFTSLRTLKEIYNEVENRSRRNCRLPKVNTVRTLVLCTLNTEFKGGEWSLSPNKYGGCLETRPLQFHVPRYQTKECLFEG